MEQLHAYDRHQNVTEQTEANYMRAQHS